MEKEYTTEEQRLYANLLDKGMKIGLAILSAMSDGRAPRASAVTVLIAGSMILFAATQKPGGYQVDQIPNTVVRTINALLP